MFASEIGANWMRWGDAVKSGATYSFHNDGPVSPPNVLLNVQTAITRLSDGGTVHGPGQIISLDDALKAQTINAAHMLHRDDLVGSITVGKMADFVELSMDPYLADPTKLATQVARSRAPGWAAASLTSTHSSVRSPRLTRVSMPTWRRPRASAARGVSDGTPWSRSVRYPLGYSHLTPAEEVAVLQPLDIRINRVPSNNM